MLESVMTPPLDAEHLTCLAIFPAAMVWWGPKCVSPWAGKSTGKPGESRRRSAVTAECFCTPFPMLAGMLGAVHKSLLLVSACMPGLPT